MLAVQSPPRAPALPQLVRTSSHTRRSSAAALREKYCAYWRTTPFSYGADTFNVHECNIVHIKDYMFLVIAKSDTEKLIFLINDKDIHSLYSDENESMRELLVSDGMSIEDVMEYYPPKFVIETSNQGKSCMVLHQTDNDHIKVRFIQAKSQCPINTKDRALNQLMKIIFMYAKATHFRGTIELEDNANDKSNGKQLLQKRIEDAFNKYPESQDPDILRDASIYSKYGFTIPYTLQDVFTAAKAGKYNLVASMYRHMTLQYPEGVPGAYRSSSSQAGGQALAFTLWDARRPARLLRTRRLRK